MGYFACLFILALTLFSSGCRPAAAPVAVSDRPVAINNQPTADAPLPPMDGVDDMTWQASDGKPQSLKDFRGKVVVLDFWATYCPPCLEGIPHFVSLQEKYKADGLEIIGLNVGGAEDFPRVPKFADRLKINYTLATPASELTEALFANRSDIPQTFVFDRNGKLLKKVVGFNAEIKAEIDSVIESALQNK